jgi:PEP-CTERM motif
MKKVITLVTLASIVGAAQAQIFNNAAGFQAAIANDPGQYLNNFTGQASGAVIAGSGGSPTMTYNITTPSGTVYGSGLFVGANVPSDSVTISFTSGNVRAVGGNFFATNISDVFVAGRAVTLTYSDGTVDTYTPGSTADFRGYVSSTILTSVVMSGMNNSNYSTVDNLITSTRAVPEPASLAALALGAVMIVRRRKNS